jgi:di/tricarboxylate transporter
MKSSRWFGLGFAFLIAVVILLLPTPGGLTWNAHMVLSVSAFAIVLWLFQVMNNGVAAILMMGLMIIAGVRPALALGGFASPSFWILVCVLYYGCAMQRTGLAQRLSYYVAISRYLCRD